MLYHQEPLTQDRGLLAQWVLGKAPKGVPSLVDEEGWADLGSIQDSLDPESTKQGLKLRRRSCIWTPVKGSSAHFFATQNQFHRRTPLATSSRSDVINPGRLCGAPLRVS